LKWSFDSLRAYGTTGKCPASHLVSRFYRIGYNALDDCRYRRLVLLAQLRLNSRFTPFQGKRSSSELRYSVVKVRVFILIIQHLVTKRLSKKACLNNYLLLRQCRIF
jgi:hypothetical protein